MIEAVCTWLALVLTISKRRQEDKVFWWTRRKS